MLWSNVIGIEARWWIIWITSIQSLPDDHRSQHHKDTLNDASTYHDSVPLHSQRGSATDPIHLFLLSRGAPSIPIIAASWAGSIYFRPLMVLMNARDGGLNQYRRCCSSSTNAAATAFPSRPKFESQVIASVSAESNYSLHEHIGNHHHDANGH